MIEPEFSGYLGDEPVTLHPPPPPPPPPLMQYSNPVMFTLNPPNDISENNYVEKNEVIDGKVKNLPLIDESQLPKVKRGRRRRFVVDPNEEIKAIKEKKTKGNNVSNKKKSRTKGTKNSNEDSGGDSSESSSDEDYYDNKDSEDMNETINEMEMTVIGNGNEKKNVRENIKKKRNREAAQQFRLRQKIYIKGLEEKLKQGEATQKNLAEEIKKSEQLNNELKIQIAESQNFMLSLVPLIRWNYESVFSVDSQSMELDPQQQQQQQQQYGFHMSAYEGTDMCGNEEKENK